MNSYILSLIMLYSSHFNVNPHLVMDVIRAESNYKIDAVGKKGEVGLMQLLPKSFPNFTVSQLKKPEVNLKLGIEYLKYVKDNCKHKFSDSFLVCYNRGLKGGSKVTNPYNDNYYTKVKGKRKW